MNPFTILKIAMHNSKEEAKIKRFQKTWSQLNPHNSTVPDNIFPPERVSVGKKTYGSFRVCSFYTPSFGNPDDKVTIGCYCSFAPKVEFFLSTEHYFSGLSSYPFKAFYLGENEARSKGSIKVCDDVWIGYDSLILSGVTLGQGCIIGARSVVAKDVPPYAIFAGGKIVKYRFTPAVIQALLELDLSKLDDSDIKDNIPLLYGNIENFLASPLCQKLRR